jgi:phosphate transport system permease protein
MTAQPSTRRRFWRQGEPFVWVTGAALTLTLLMIALLILIVLFHGLGSFWPSRLAQASLVDGTQLLGEISERERSPDGKEARIQFKVGNRDLYAMDFRWVPEPQIKLMRYPADAVALERREHGNFYGTLGGLKTAGLEFKPQGGPWEQLAAARESIAKAEKPAQALKDAMAKLSGRKEAIRQKILKIEYRNQGARPNQIKILEAESRQLDGRFNEINAELSALTTQLRANVALFKDAAGQEKQIPLVDIVRAWRPNTMSASAKGLFYLSKIKELLLDEPREANTEGGLLPAIFGTVLMVLLMSLFCIPLGVVAAVYLREYAKEGILVRLVRIAVNNLAGVPSIVYGVFGLGFFVYGVGATLDRIFFPERLPSPTFGTGGLLWASLTLALLTVPVVIVTTEEALAAVPRGIREGSLALGATRFQTLMRILLPMASPGIMTGLILAMARAAGEVAPLMIVGVVKLAPKLPLDGQFPFLHLERKFMHLGFHIYDVGFQSPNVEAAKPMVFVTTLLLLLIVIVMSAAAIHLRKMMRKRYATGAF